MRAQGGGRAVLGYRDHSIVDGGKARILLSALVSPASIRDNIPLLDLLDWTCSQYPVLLCDSCISFCHLDNGVRLFQFSMLCLDEHIW
jgi:hypothetical protein